MSRSKKFIVWSAIILFSILAGAIIMSPYGRHAGFKNKLILHSVEINKSPEKVFAYLGNSANAKNWSVYVDHIRTLNADSIPDGQVGSRRRCFTAGNEEGTQWDELITIVEPNKKRQLTCYNLVDFAMSAENLRTEQIYEVLPEGKCRLSFTLYFHDGKSTMWDEFKTYIAAYKVKSIFGDNMNNIKAIVENQKY